MSTITLKTGKRTTSASGQKIKEAVSAAYAQKSASSKTTSTVVRVTKKISTKVTPLKSS